MQAQDLVQNIETSEKIKSHLIQVLEAFQNLDYHKLNELLDDEAYYEDMKKTAFIYKQMQIFKELRKNGDTHLNLSTNICASCLCSEPVFVLTGNKSGHKYAIYIQFTQGEITDIFRCSEHSDWLNGMLPF
ncbi:MAG: hypothetical protein CMP05_07105 [Xanthomarina sp.]|uniref:hypothetical protein n=1 Tax=Xanthomarina sp. TaxID=1931211 RepID=UPI000C3EC7C0|nr:hypothetical protein [Xanthomarina sp.]MAL23067.1 hypothetical protein [Xanthomarina sp.]MBF61752.1 hypothetical protein [Xanthomarina sp.]HAB28140.1 hypothetical protein [Xanthomarina gelatinilytica]|tara:strand:+ start:74 stop:466 length:393 start_codon:yes stop_codon:yes gene_type:complete